MQSLDAEANALDLSDWAEAYLAVLDENDGEAVRDAVETIFSGTRTVGNGTRPARGCG